MPKLPYNVGDWFAVPLRTGGYALGLIARSAPNGRILLGYFFGPRYGRVPTLDALPPLAAEDAVGVWRFGDLSLFEGDWPIIGPSAGWTPEAWPIPPFHLEHPITGLKYRIDYSDADPSEPIAETRLDHAPSDAALERDSLLGAGAVEIALTRLLDPSPDDPARNQRE